MMTPSPMMVTRTPPTLARHFLTAEESLGSRTQGMDMRMRSMAGRPSRQAKTIRARDVWM